MNIWSFLSLLFKREDTLLQRVSELKEFSIQTLTKLEKIMSAQSEAARQLKEATDRQEKARLEITGKLSELDSAIQQLQDRITAGLDTISPELQAAIDAVVAKSHELDDIVADDLGSSTEQE